MNYDVNRYAGDLLDGTLNRLNPSFADIQYGQARGSSFYNGFNASVRKRYSAGLDLQVAYTFGKAVDDSSTFGRGLRIVDAANIRSSRGLADFDARQKLSISLLYETPNIGKSMFLTMLSKWELGAVTILQAGSPFSVFCSQSFIPVLDASGKIVGNSGCDYNADGLTYDFPNAPGFAGYKRGYSRQDYLNGIFKATDFPAPPLGMEGSLGRNTFYGPGYANTNLNIVKRFPLRMLGETGRVDFRTELFNLFNRTNLGVPVGDLTSPQFGRSTTALGARNVQFGLRVQF
jgi:hypothetical protein